MQPTLVSGATRRADATVPSTVPDDRADGPGHWPATPGPTHCPTCDRPAIDAQGIDHCPGCGWTSVR